MKKEDFLIRKKKGLFNGFYGSLSYSETEASIERFLPMFHKVGQPWGWSNISKYRDIPSLNKHFNNDNANLLYLLDDLKIVGYCLLTNPERQTQDEILNGYADYKIAEIENLGLFPNQTGKGRGHKFFEMMLDRLFEKNDCVYWSMTSTNHSGLLEFYTKKIGMELIKTTYAPNPLLSNTQNNTYEKQAA